MFAFTVSELIIALIVIGIVATVTLPTLVNNYKKHTTASKVKKFYVTFSQSIRMAIIENGDFKTWNCTNGTELYENYLKPYIKVVSVSKNVQVNGDFLGGILMYFTDGSSAICSRGQIAAPATTVLTIYTVYFPQTDANLNSPVLPQRLQHEIFFGFS